MSQQLSDASANFIFSRTRRDPRVTERRRLASPGRIFPYTLFRLGIFSSLSFLMRESAKQFLSGFSLSLSLCLSVSLSARLARPVLSLRLFTFIRGKLEPQRPPIIAGEIIKKAGAGEILKRRREGRPLSAGRYRSTAMLGSTSSPRPLCNSPRFPLPFQLNFASQGVQT